MKQITAALPIKRYQPPQYLVEPTEGPVDADELESINTLGYLTLESYPNVRGWGEYTLIIRVGDEAEGSYDYVATTE